MEINHSTGSIISLLKIDTTIAPPQGLANVFTIIGSGGLVLPLGATNTRPAEQVAGTLRYNTQTSLLEFDNGSAWTTIRKSHVTITTATGLNVSTDGTTFSSTATILDDGTFTFALGTELVALSALNSAGLVARATDGVYTSIAIVGTTGNVVVTHGDATGGAPTINLATAGTAVADVFKKFTTDSYGRVTATSVVGLSDITTALGYSPVNVAGDTMTGVLILSADPATGSNGLQAVTKDYVDRLVSGGATWRNPVVDPNLVDVISGDAEPVAPVYSTSYIVTSPAVWTGGFTVAANDVVAWNHGNSSWVKVTELAAGQRFIVAAEYGSVGPVLALAGFVDGDLVQYVSGDPSLFASWISPEGRSGLSEAGVEIAQGTTVLTSYGQSPHVGHSYLYDAVANHWIEIAGPGSILLGTGLSYVGTTVSLDTVAVAKGGTGLTTTGSANQILGVMDSSGTLEYKTIVGGTGITVNNTAGEIQIVSTGGTITSIAATTTSVGLSISGSPITDAGTFEFTLNAELQALAGLTTTGLVARTAADTYTPVTLTGTSGNIVITSGDAIGGNPTFDLATITQASTGSFVKVTLDTFGRVVGNSSVTATDIRDLTPYTNGSGLTLTDDTFALAAIGTAVSDSFVKVTTDVHGRVTATSAVTAQDILDVDAYSTTTSTGLSLTAGVFAITTIPVANGGTGLAAAGAAQTVLGVNADGSLGYKAVSVTGSGISATITDSAITLENTGVTSLVAGTGIEISSATGAITVTNTGVTSVAVSGGKGVAINGTAGSEAIPATGSVTATGTIAITLSSELQSLTNISENGVISYVSGSYVSRTLTGTAGRIVVTDGVGASGNPTFDLATVGTAVSDSFVRVTTDAYGRVTATAAVQTSDITALVDATYVNLSGDTMAASANLTFNGGEILGLPTTPSSSTAAASKAYVDSVAAGLDPKQSVQAASTANITGYSDLAGAAGNGGFPTAPATLDGITLSTAGQRILVKNQTDAKQNGIYVVVSSTVWQRSADQDGTPASEVSSGNFVFVEGGGVVNGTTGWVLTGQGTLALNTSDINWVQFSGANTYLGGNGITITGNSIALSAPVVTTNGGTGLSSIGAANGFLSVNAAGTGLEYKAIEAGTAIGIDASVTGHLSISNLGVTAVAVGTGMAVTSSTGSITVSLNSELQALSGLSGTGIMVRTGANTYSEVSLVGTSGNIVITSGDGTGTPTFDLATVSQGISGNFVKVSIDAFGRVIGNANVTAADIRGLNAYSVTGSTGLSLATGVFAITTVPTANGGTGLTAVGSANQVLGVNAAGTGLEYKTIAASTGISVTNTAGVLTVANTGVTSVGLSVPSFLSVDSSPVTTTGTIAVSLATQSTNVIFAGPASGVDATPTFRSLSVDDLPIKLYKENVSSPVANTVSGTNAVAIGTGATATANESIAFGKGSVARQVGSKVFANGSFATAGDAQSGIYVLRNQTTSATTTELYLDGSAAQLVLPTNSAVTYQAMVVGRRTDGAGEVAAYRIEGVVFKDATNLSTAMVGTASKTILGEVDSAWNVAVSVDTTTGAITFAVTGEADKTIRWVATVITSEVTN